jgi:hypothetical protein
MPSSEALGTPEKYIYRIIWGNPPERLLLQGIRHTTENPIQWRNYGSDYLRAYA